MNTCRSEVECSDGRGLTQSDEKLVQCENVIRAKDVRAFSRNQDVEVIAYPKCELFELGAGDVRGWSHRQWRCRMMSKRHG